MIQPAAGCSQLRVEGRRQFSGLFVGFLQGVEWSPAGGCHLVQRRAGLGGVEHLDDLVTGGRAKRPFLADPFLGLLPDIHQAQPSLPVATDRILHGVVGVAGHALHRREKVGIGMR